jgi:Uri superfamily endonuclease
MKLDTERKIHTGRLGVLNFPCGYYAYTGSALGGFKSRIKRHLSQNKKHKWHIDYFLNEAEVLQITLCITEKQLECVLAQALSKDLLPVPHFGSSDCRCKSHLYFSDNQYDLKYSVNKSVAGLVSQYDVVEGNYYL